MRQQVLFFLTVILLAGGWPCIVASRLLKGTGPLAHVLVAGAPAPGVPNSNQTVPAQPVQINPNTTVSSNSTTASKNAPGDGTGGGTMQPPSAAQGITATGVLHAQQGSLLTFLAIIFGTFMVLVLAACGLSWRHRWKLWRRELELNSELADKEADLLQRIPQPIVVIMPDKQIMSARKVQENKGAESDADENDDELLKKLGPRFHEVDISIHSLRDMSVRSGRAFAIFRTESKKQLSSTGAGNDSKQGPERTPSQCLSATVAYDSSSDGDEPEERTTRRSLQGDVVGHGSGDCAGSSGSVSGMETATSGAGSSKGGGDESNGEETTCPSRV